MKKKTKQVSKDNKLKVKKSTVRPMQSDKLDQVAGGLMACDTCDAGATCHPGLR